MPFLCVLLKQSATATPNGASPSRVDELRLNELLCPYRGRIQRVPIAMQGSTIGVLRLSSLARVCESTCVIPAGTNKNPGTAWLEITVEPNGITFETDPLGTFPLWWCEDDARVVITSEVKSLVALQGVTVELDESALQSARHPADFSPFRGIRRVYPGATLHVSPVLELTEERRAPLAFRPASMFATEAVSEDALEAALITSVSAMCADGGANVSWGAFLSGGIDSSLATALIHTSHPDVQTFTLGTSLGDEYADAEALTSHLGLAHRRVTADEEAALVHFERAVFCNEMIDGLTAETLAQLGVLAAAAAAGNVRHVVTGYGADLLFGSMLRHRQYMDATAVDDLQSLIERTCWTGEFAPFYAWSHGIEVHHLFWHPAVMNIAFHIPPEYSFDGTEEKVLLRRLAAERGHLDHRHVRRKKQAMTDGTQFNRVLSSALGIGDSYAYGMKNARCLAQLRNLLDRNRTEDVAS